MARTMDFITTCRPKIRKKRSTDFTLWENKRVSFISSIFWLQSERLETILHTILYAFPLSLKRRICLKIISFFVWSSFPLISWSSCEIQQWSALFIRGKLNAYVGCSSFAQKLNFSRRGSIIGKACCPVLSKKDIMLIQIAIGKQLF